jgi:hypothetical protein
MGVPGLSHNMTPMTHTASMNYKKLESSVKDFVEARNIIESRGGHGMGISTSRSAKTSSSPIHPIRSNVVSEDYVEINTSYTGTTPDVAARLGNLKATEWRLPDLPPPGPRMDTITGKFEAPDGNGGFKPWVKNPKGFD